jgi:threonine/homoserine/homoserine lactone efflux protein
MFRERLSASDPQPQGSAEARSAGRTVLIICAVLACMVSVIIVSRLLHGGPLSPLSVALPVLGLAWVAWLGLKMWRSAPALDTPTQRGERPSRRLPRFEPAAGPRSDRPSDSGGHVGA